MSSGPPDDGYVNDPLTGTPVAGFVLGLGVGGIVFAGVCAGFIAWIDASLGG